MIMIVVTSLSWTAPETLAYSYNDYPPLNPDHRDHDDPHDDQGQDHHVHHDHQDPVHDVEDQGSWVSSQYFCSTMIIMIPLYGCSHQHHGDDADLDDDDDDQDGVGGSRCVGESPSALLAPISY